MSHCLLISFIVSAKTGREFLADSTEEKEVVVVALVTPLLNRLGVWAVGSPSFTSLCWMRFELFQHHSRSARICSL